MKLTNTEECVVVPLAIVKKIKGEVMAVWGKSWNDFLWFNSH